MAESLVWPADMFPVGAVELVRPFRAVHAPVARSLPAAHTGPSQYEFSAPSGELVLVVTRIWTILIGGD
jgi:hypothetical protein